MTEGLADNLAKYSVSSALHWRRTRRELRSMAITYPCSFVRMRRAEVVSRQRRGGLRLHLRSALRVVNLRRLISEGHSSASISRRLDPMAARVGSPTFRRNDVKPPTSYYLRGGYDCIPPCGQTISIDLQLPAQCRGRGKSKQQTCGPFHIPDRRVALSRRCRRPRFRSSRTETEPYRRRRFPRDRRPTDPSR
jgi:hypothetical protein